MDHPIDKTILVTGATGYVGGRVIFRLLDAGFHVRAMGRSIEKLQSRAWADHPNIELVEADVLDIPKLTKACDGCSVAYYFVHSMKGESGDFVDIDRQAARNMVAVAKATKLKRIIYLGGLGLMSKNLSPHLRSRAEVAAILKSGPIPVTHLRAAMILGSGSAAFEMLRYLVQRLPIMITSKRVFTPSHPIAIRNVLVYLVECLKTPETIGRTFDLGGPDIVTYREMIDIYADEVGLKKRIVIPLSFMTPRLMSYVAHHVTPIPASIVEPLSEGLGNEMVVKDGHMIRDIIPQKLLTVREAIRMAHQRIEQKVIKSSWMDAGEFDPPEWGRHNDPFYSGGDIRESWFEVALAGTPKEVWEPISRIGGERGWYFANWLWNLRGLIDRLAGGYGTRRGRRHPKDIRAGDALDWWRVIDATPGERLLLKAEMKAPGEATLEFLMASKSEGITVLTQKASFLPRGVPGLLYWYTVWPFHFFIFRGMLRGIAKSAGVKVVSGPFEVTPVRKD